MLSRRTHRLLRAGGAVLGSAAAAAVVTGGTFAAFNATSGSSGNLFSASPDWVGPTVNAVVTSKGTGVDGYVHPGGTYRVYADVPNDSGAPPSGTKTVVTDVTALTAGEGAVDLAAGTFVRGGTTYNRRSALLTVEPGTSEGVKTFTLTATDNDDNETHRIDLPVTVDATPPAATDVQTSNGGGGTTGRPEAGDQITYTFSERVEPDTILTGWSGSPGEPVTVRLADHAGGDTITVYDEADTTATALGVVDLAGTDYTTADVTFADSTIDMSTTAPWTVTVTLGTASGPTTTQAGSTTSIWTPQAGITDIAGNDVPTTARSETGAADAEL
ncbi:MAG: hypothetical protein JWQ20_4122 [Conexibacter sp.]|nr:hypothetical protein [Conexibacter sp.]